MKFGKTLTEMVRVEWKEFAVDYKGMKKCLPKPETALSDSATYSDFWNLFHKCEETLTDFYHQKKEWAEYEATSLQKQVEKLRMSKLLDANLKCSSSAQETQQELEKFKTEVKYMNEFLSINLTAFRKILKKFDKRTDSNLQVIRLEEVRKTLSFLDGSAMDGIFQKVDRMVDQLHEIEGLPDNSPLRRQTDNRRASLQTEAARKMIATAKKFVDDMVESSPFFSTNAPKFTPQFDNDEIELGGYLGEGEFGIVREVKDFLIEDSCPICVIHQFPDKDITAIETDNGNPAKNFEIKPEPIRRSSFRSSSGVADLADLDQQSFQSDHIEEDKEISTNRGFMKHHCFRDGSARYAIKQLKKSLTGKQLQDGAIDLSIEAKFLSVLSHPNIIKLCGIGGTRGHPSAFIILDRLYKTLGTKIEYWKAETSKFNGRFCGIGKQNNKLQLLWEERLLAAYDVANAMNHLHKHEIIYRDTKPENIGFDVRGTAKVFDFGLSKELLEKDKIRTDQYKASGRTGTRRYMAPEVALCKYYGKPADVYSFGILLWQTLSLSLPFKGYDYEKHAQLVVQKQKRPALLKAWPTLLKLMIERAWDNNPAERPSFEQICSTICGELVNIDFATRHQEMMDCSISFHRSRV